MPLVSTRRSFLALASALAATASGRASAQAYPARPIRLVVPSTAGAGVTDIMARLVGQKLGESLGQQVVVDNRPGASGILGSELVAKAPNDGYTLLIANVSLIVNPYLYARMPYDPLADFMPITMVNTAPQQLVVHPSVPATTVAELVTYAKTRPGQLNYGSGGLGSTPFLAAELFKSITGIDVVHVPYKGGGPAIAELVGGQLTFMIENVPGTMPHVKSGKLRALAITSTQRSPLAPDLPTMIEAGVPGYEMDAWNAIFAPKGTPPDILARLHAELVRVLRGPEMKEQCAALGAEPIGNTPDELAAFLKADKARWGEIIQARGIKPE
jgi:tripartite-type tricarboxylate transporter receptor subunit TctC